MGPLGGNHRVGTICLLDATGLVLLRRAQHRTVVWPLAGHALPCILLTGGIHWGNRRACTNLAILGYLQRADRAGDPHRTACAVRSDRSRDEALSEPRSEVGGRRRGDRGVYG